MFDESMKKIVLTMLVLGVIIISGCAQKNVSEITNFKECAAAGNPVMESYPRQCAANGQTFIEKISDEERKRSNQPICVNQCGDSKCAEIVCLGTGCPCAESKETCPEDCG